MKHEYEDHIICPHCDHDHQEWWEFGVGLTDGNNEDVTCDSCGEDFNLTVNVGYSFCTERIRCEKGCNFGEWERHNEVDQVTADRWNREKFCGRTDHKPYLSYIKYCKDCENTEYRTEET